MSVRRYEAGDTVEVRGGSFKGRRGTVLERIDDMAPGRVLYLVQFPEDEPARWFVAGRLRKARSPDSAPG
jgi:hypothetical protein